MFDQFTTLELMDGLACALLAAAAACRARGFGAHFTGAIALGCVCGLAGPLAREAILHGEAGSRMIANALCDDALIGALAGLAALALWKRGGLFFWVDAAGMGLCSSLAAAFAAPTVGVAGGLGIGFIAGLLPGMLRDMALGDVAMLVEKEWYASAVAIGCAFAIFIGALPVIWQDARPLLPRILEYAAIGGCCATMFLRRLKGYGPGND